ncbi:putative GEM-like protein 8 [Iris pallida]|uniref:GEM-like protein 8 n=1 Tax=Iris pallida TaxID=29817 RepID=A0AAX6HI14_IRIPA|nr:putative GEM-like protein 8 [Iris pallida]
MASIGQVIGIPVGSVSYAATTEESAASSPDADSLCDHCKQDRKRSFTNWMTNLKAKTINRMQAFRNNVNKGAKEKLRLGGKAERVFRQAFCASSNNDAGTGAGEELVRATKCSLWTTAGPIAGTLFVSTARVAFLSDCSIRLSYPDGTVARVPYRVVVPLARIKKANSERLSKPADKYVQILTIDDFELWFVGIPSHDKFFSHLQRTIIAASLQL